MSNITTESKEKPESTARRVLLVGDTTLDPLARLLERGAEQPNLKCFAASYGQVYQILLDSNHLDWSSKPEILVVWTTPELILPSFAKLLRFEFESAGELHARALSEVDQFANAVLNAAPHANLVLVPAWFLPAAERWIQTLTWRPGMGVGHLLAAANLRLAEKFSTHQNIVLLDTGNWLASLTQPEVDPRMYAVAKIRYTQELFSKAASEMKAILRGCFGQSKKVIVCDLDNTLWGGVVGDEGPQSIRLGAPDPVGECFSTFQAVLKGLRNRGILLAICSKNDEALALSVIEEHPGMILRKNDFVAWRINWKDKAENLLSLAEELNLGLESFVFLDDSPQERNQISQLLPQVLTPELPASPPHYALFLSSLNCFETLNIGKEDRDRTKMYQAERERKDTLNLSGDIENWLRSLQIEVRAAPLRPETLPRAAQLLNKTNQFNLSLRRLDEKSFWEWSTSPFNSTITYDISDRFGDFGLAAVASFSISGTEARIVDFVMSCRVMGKKVEEALLAHTVTRAIAAGANRVQATCVHGPRNQPAKGFFSTKLSDKEDSWIDPSLVGIPPQLTFKEEA